ncbi:hypothetical protein [Flavobacterium sp.]|uniref:hypothetical protein n=1 Tax=Flavobacterium sp. TaxID=239 RepID=UPI0011F9791B|nr:hypothetical protein [Flavobacterium sp.]RZJ72126.1 MAG: hypothetical protein EOO49_06650 [Flavobacterium sp.]
MKYFYTALFFVLASYAFGQWESPMDKLDERLIAGDFKALHEISDYLDSKMEIEDNLGYHLLQTRQDVVARRKIAESSFFTEAEIKLDTSLTSKKFEDFLKANAKSIKYDPEIQAFYITPFEKREVVFGLRELTKARRKLLDSLFAQNSEWLENPRQRKLWDAKDPKLLTEIASELLRKRYRRNSSYDEKEIVQRLQHLAGTIVGVKDHVGKLNFHSDEDFYTESKLNLYIFFVRNYRKFYWNASENRFATKDLPMEKNDRERELFDQLFSGNDKDALEAFTILTQSDTAKVAALCNEFEAISSVSRANYVLPLFPFRFLKQLSILTSYCQANQISLNLSRSHLLSCRKLETKMDARQTRQLEDDLINSLTLAEISAFEYHFLIRLYSFDSMVSVSRILDKFYSRHWNEVVENQQELALYLKKAELFKRFQISGSCRNYLLKFRHADGNIAKTLKELKTQDVQIEESRKKALLEMRLPIYFEVEKKWGEDNRDTIVVDLVGLYRKVIKDSVGNRYLESDVQKVLSLGNYDQMEQLFEIATNYKFDREQDRYEFLDRDFGFDPIDFSQPGVAKRFLENYRSMSQNELYEYYLDEIGISRKTDGELDFAKMYDILKYDSQTEFVGGATKTSAVYMIVKLLEIKFATTLGYPKKLCNSSGIYGCSIRERSGDWRHFLEEKGLVSKSFQTPVSFSLIPD